MITSRVSVSDPSQSGPVYCSKPPRGLPGKGKPGLGPWAKGGVALMGHMGQHEWVRPMGPVGPMRPMRPMDSMVSRGLSPFGLHATHGWEGPHGPHGPP